MLDGPTAFLKRASRLANDRDSVAAFKEHPGLLNDSYFLSAPADGGLGM
jgi:hypothetical protein